MRIDEKQNQAESPKNGLVIYSMINFSINNSSKLTFESYNEAKREYLNIVNNSRLGMDEKSSKLIKLMFPKNKNNNQIPHVFEMLHNSNTIVSNITELKDENTFKVH